MKYFRVHGKTDAEEVAKKFSKEAPRECLLCGTDKCEDIGIFLPIESIAYKLGSKTGNSMLPYWICKKCKKKGVEAVDDKFLKLTAHLRQ